MKVKEFTVEIETPLGVTAEQLYDKLHEMFCLKGSLTVMGVSRVNVSDESTPYEVTEQELKRRG